MSMQIFLGKPPASIEQWIIDHYAPAADPKTYIKFSDGTEFYDVIEFPDGLDGVFDLRTAAKYGWTNEGDDGYDGPPEWDNKQPVEAVLGSNVTSIGNYAFYGCSGLTSVVIPDSVASIGDYAFTGCTGLADSEGFVIVRNFLYGYYGDDSDVTIPDLVTSIEDQAFFQYMELTNVTIGNSVTSIRDAAFYGCRGLTSVNIPDSVTSIGSSAFCDCSGLTSVEFEGNAPTVGSTAFNGVASGCKAIITSTATGFPEAGETWNGLIVEVKS